MSASKSERLVNLAYLLRSSPRPLTKADIFRRVDGYAALRGSGRDRTFERDKDDLRSGGVEIELIRAGADDSAEDRYWLAAEKFELPAIEFTPAEAMVLGVATHVWAEAGAAQLTNRALAKLTAGGAQLARSTEPELDFAPVLAAKEPGFEVLLSAVGRRRVVEFSYRSSSEQQTTSEKRTVEPWSLPYRHGSWYLIGFDRGRGAARCFKLARLSSEPKLIGADGAYEIPRDHDPHSALQSLRPGEHTDLAVIAVRRGHAPALTRRGSPVASPTALPEGFDCWQVPFNRHADVVGEAAAASTHAVVLAPPWLREAVLERLNQVVSR